MKNPFLLIFFLLPNHCSAFHLTHKLVSYYNNMRSRALMTSTTEEEGAPGSLRLLCTISLRACEVMTPLISTIYNDLSKNKVKAKQDNSAFTIADGLVQRLLYVLFESVQFRGIVGEEETSPLSADEESWTRQVDGMTIPKHILPIVQTAKSEIKTLAGSLCGDYSKISVFIDPIDGTKEFSTGKGEQCSICIGFADENGKAVGGVVYRPLTLNPTWAAGAISEQYVVNNFDLNAHLQDDEGLLTSNGSISTFIESLMIELGMKRVKAGGAGNKMLLLLERSLQLANNSPMSSILYIQDRGVSRWDTCAAEAVLEAFGGKILKLTSIHGNTGNSGEMNNRYTYLKTDTNLDFVPGIARCSKYNSVSCDAIQPNQMADDVNQVKPYSNLCGLVAVGKEWNNVEGMKLISDAIHRAGEKNAPSYD